MSGNPEVRGVQVDPQTRCVHYHTAADVIAIKMRCCGVYYSCKDCHEKLAGHKTEVWPEQEWTEKAVLCGCCRTELSIEEYLASGYRCPACHVQWNPGCSKHHRFYFAAPSTISA